MARLPAGLFELLLDQRTAEGVPDPGETLVAEQHHLDPANAPDHLATWASRVVQETLEGVAIERRNEIASRLASTLARSILLETDAAADSNLRLLEPPMVLHGIHRSNPDGSPVQVPRPQLPLRETALMTNARGEARVGHHLLTEIPSAHRIDIVMAFIRRTGITPFLDAFERHRNEGRPLRILTTTYTGSTQQSALDALTEVGADIRVSYDEDATRLHAKSWLFDRDTGFSTAYVGSSNMTHAAQITGLEWNIRVSQVRNPPVVSKVRAMFEHYWQSPEFDPYDPVEFAARARNRSTTTAPTPQRPLQALPFQEQLLNQIALERLLGRHRNLLVAATGTGKTVMAALDYARIARERTRARLLFVAHRKEILDQALRTFRAVLANGAFGALWVGGARPERFDHVFASIQSLDSAGYAALDPTYYDVVILDEFHHAAAPTYERLLNHVKPRELLGLTATPERSDGAPILSWFDGRVAAELRLWDAIDQQRLTPFSYFGVHDGTDLSDLPWKRGRGYAVDALDTLYTGNDVWAHLVLHHLRRKGPDVGDLRAIGFCVSVRHAAFMAHVFQRAGVPSVAISGTTPRDERARAIKDLEAGSIKVIFAVDLFNEGVDIPSVNTLLMLRPTDSSLLFQQQLGRGLRKHPGKSLCTVLDFVGLHRNEYRVHRRLGALLPGSRSEIGEQVREGFPRLPAGCHMELDPVARDLILDNLKRSVPNRFTERADELRRLAASQGTDISLGSYLEHVGLELPELYQGANPRGWSDLREAAGLAVESAGPDEQPLRKAVGRLLHVDDLRRIRAYRRVALAARTGEPFETIARSTTDLRMARMLLASLFNQIARRGERLSDSYERLGLHPQVTAELLEILEVLETSLDHLTLPLASRPTVPLEIHAHYTRIEIVAAFGHLDEASTVVYNWQSGVLWLPDANADLLTITMDKSHDAFTARMKYRDYAIDRFHVHWESQSATREASRTGKRYQNHDANGSDVYLFARHDRSERAFSLLGGAHYVKHQGEQPMAVTWKLTTPLPTELLESFAAAVA